MKVTFLGTGTSQGVPMIGCTCPVCTSTDPRDNRMRSALWIEDDQSFVIDTPPDFRIQALRAGILRLDAAVFTHAHADHIMGFDDLRRFSEINGGSFPVYASPETMDRLRHVYDYAFDSSNTVSTYLHPVPHLITGPFFLGSLELVPLPVPHGRTTTLGFLFRRQGRKLGVYLNDCASVPSDVLDLIMDTPCLIIDGLRDAPHPTHLSIGQAVEVSRQCRAGTTYLTHMTHEKSHATRLTELPPGILPAHDGLVLEW